MCPGNGVFPTDEGGGEAKGEAAVGGWTSNCTRCKRRIYVPVGQTSLTICPLCDGITEVEGPATTQPPADSGD